MRQYYEEPITPAEFSLGKPARDTSGNLVFMVTFQKDNREHYYYLIETDQGYKVDWEASVGHCAMSWVDFKSKKPSFPVRFRVAAQLSVFYVGKYSDGLQWMCLQVFSETGGSAYAYTRRHSECGEKLYDALRDGTARRLTLDLRFSEEKEIEIVDLVAPGWVIPSTVLLASGISEPN